VFSGEPLRAVEQLRRTEVIPPALLGDYQKLLNSNPARRLNPSQAGGLPMGLSGPYGGWPLRHAACGGADQMSPPAVPSRRDPHPRPTRALSPASLAPRRFVAMTGGGIQLSEQPPGQSG
jgi:hypothetical protein